MQIAVNVFLKNGVLDPQAKAVKNALHALNFNQVQDIKMAKQIIITLDTDDEKEAKNLVKQMCDALLVNAVIEEYEFV